MDNQPLPRSIAHASRWVVWHQLLGMIRYEFLLHWRRRALFVLFLAAVAVPFVAALRLRQELSEVSQTWVQAGGVAPTVASDVVTTNMILMTWAPMFLVLLLLLPPVVADTIPRDKSQGVRELLDSLPLSTGTYLAGKLFSVWASVSVGALGSLGFIGAVWWFLVGPFNFDKVLELLVFGVGPVVVLNASLGMLLAAGQPSRYRAVFIGVALAIVSLYLTLIAFNATIDFWYWFNPGRPAIFAFFIWGGRMSVMPNGTPLPTWNDVWATIGIGLAQLVMLAATMYAWLRWRANS